MLLLTGILLSVATLKNVVTDTLTTHLINSVYLEVVDHKAKYYYLKSVGSNPDLDEYDIKDLVNYKLITAEIPFDEFLNTIKTDTTKINWNTFHLKNARSADNVDLNYGIQTRIICYMPYNTPDSILQKKKADGLGVIIVLVKPGMSARQVSSAERKAVKIYEDTPVEEKYIYRFSKPIYAKDKHYALIGLNGGGRGCLYVFKLIEGKWTKIFSFKCWVA